MGFSALCSPSCVHQDMLVEKPGLPVLSSQLHSLGTAVKKNEGWEHRDQTSIGPSSSALAHRQLHDWRPRLDLTVTTISGWKRCRSCYAVRTH